MGNRAVLTFSTAANAPCIYLHWNGGMASVEGFLSAARTLGLRRMQSQAETMDQLATMIARHFFGVDVGMTVYRERYGQSDANNYDNGVYKLAPDLTISGRIYKLRMDEIDPVKAREIHDYITAKAPIFND